MRKLNVARMKRYVARTTPDVVIAHFDPLSDSQQDYEKWLHQFATRMGVKYGSSVKINVMMEDDYIHNNKKVTARAVPYSKEE